MSKWEEILRRVILFLAVISSAVWVWAQAPEETPPSIPLLIAKINGAGPVAREEIAHALARIGRPSVEPLITALRHRDSKVRGVSARALELMGKKAEPAVAALIACLAGTEPPDDPKPTRKPDFDGVDWGRPGEPVPSVYERALREIGEPAVSALVTQLDGRDQRARVLALRALGFVFDEKKVALNRLMALLEDPALRFEAATALGGISPSPRRAIPRLIAALKDADPAFRARAAETIGRIGWARMAGQYSTTTVARGAVAPLCESLADADPRVRAAAVTALGDIGPEATVATPRIIRMFEDPVVEVRLAALRAFQRNGPAPGDDTSSVVPLLEDTDVRIRLAAFSVIGESLLNTDQVFTDIASALADQDPKIRAGAMSLLSGAFQRTQPIGTTSSLRIIGDALRRCLSERDAHLRQSAARLLAHFPSQAGETVPMLVERLKDDDADVREAAAWSLGAFGSKAGAAIPSLFERLDDPGKNSSDRSSVAARAAVSITQINPQSTDQVIRRLLGQLAQPDEAVAAAGVNVLSALGPKGSSVLWRVLSDPKKSRRVRATALETLTWAHKTRDLQTGPREPVIDNAVPMLRELVRQGDPDMGQNACELLAAIQTQDDEITELYVTSIHVKNLNRRLSTFNLRDKLKPAMIPFLLQGLSDPDGEVRAELLLAIAKLVRALPVPTTDFEDGEDPPRPTPEEREKLASALQVKVRAAHAILPLLKDRDPSVRWNAAALLGELGVQANLVVPALTRMLRTETDPVSQNDRTTGLAPLQSNYFDVGMYALPRIWPEVVELRLSAIGALGRFRDEAVEAVPELVAILRTEKDMRIRWFTAAAIHQIGPAARAAVPTLIELLRSREVVELPPDNAREADDDNDPMPLRLAAAVALGGIGAPARAAVPDLVQSLADKDAKVRAEAAWALGEIGGDAALAIPGLVKLTGEETDDGVANQGVHALGKIGAKAVPALTARMKAGDADLRIRFVTALGEVGSGAALAIPDLAQAAVDADEEIRTAAVEALGFVGKGSAASAVIPILISGEDNWCQFMFLATIGRQLVSCLGQKLN